MTESHPSVSIVVLNWNGKGHLADCLASLLALDYPESKLQIILCDNGSTDGSADFVRRTFPKVTLLTLDHNYGFAEGNNRAAREAGGEWVGFLNNDMRVEPTWLNDLIAPLPDHPQAVCLASRIMNWNGSAVDFVGGGVNFQGHGFQVDVGKPTSSQDTPRRLLFACGGAMLVRRDLFLEVGGFDRDFFAFFEDVDLGWRLNLLGHDVWYSPAATAYHRHHGTASRIDSHQLRVLYERNALAMIYKCFDDDNLAAALPTALLLQNERALSVSGLNRRSFDFNDQASTSDSEQGTTGGPALSRPAGVLARGRRVVRQEGLAMAARKAFHLLDRWFAAVMSATVGLARPRYFVVRGVALSHYIAQSQFAHQLESLNKKRAWIQSRRTRTDPEILPLFEDAFYSSHQDAEYERFYRWLCRVQGLDRRFGSAQD
jgi:GT2 family glycosyltransferase